MGRVIELNYNGELGYNQSIGEVINFFKVRIDPNEFLDFKENEQELTNRERIFNQYDVKTKIKQNLADPEGEDITGFESITLEMPCPVPMVFFIDGDFVTRDIIVNQGNLLADNFSVTNLGDSDGEQSAAITAYNNKFFKENIDKFSFNLERPNSENARNSYININDSSKLSERQMLNPTVWIWCKSLNEDGKFNPNSIFNLSPFIQSLDVNNTETGGNFSIDLLPIEGMIDIDPDGNPVGVWHPKKSQYVKFNKNDRTNYHFKNILNKVGTRKLTDEGNFSDTSFGRRYQNISTNNLNAQDVRLGDETETTIRSEVLFKNMISENDVIFISFHERNIPEEFVDDFFIGHENLKDQEWDMIGLVDTNSTGIVFENTTVSSDIAGRDLMKLLLDDGSYFFAKSFTNPDDSNTAFDNVDLPNSGDDVNTTNNVIENGGNSVNRLVTNGMINMLFNAEARNVHFVMNLLISKLANIEICPSQLFEYYANSERGDIRTRFSVPTYETVKAEVESDADIDKD